MILSTVVLLWVLAAVLPYRLLPWRHETQTVARHFVVGLVCIPTVMYAKMDTFRPLFFGVCMDICGNFNEETEQLISDRLPPVIAITCALIALSLYLRWRFHGRDENASEGSAA